MCGICGIVYSDPLRKPEESLVRAMCGKMAHRGPDDEGVYFGPGIGLGHRRLSIIDVAASRQPLGNEDGNIHVVFNGEIYNFQELRSELAARGHRFRTEGDTEVLAHLYEERGPGMVRELDGMFAFAIWDGARRTLFMARDRMGKKPLFYHPGKNYFAFASELRPLMALKDIPREVRRAAVDDYLVYGYVPCPDTIFENVYKLSPGNCAIVENGSVRAAPYWDAGLLGREDQMEPAEARETLRRLMENAVRRRMVADVPLGAFLSGGIDSSIVVGLMSRCSTAPVKTFSIGFDEGRFSELPFARAVARRFRTDHHEEVVKADAVAVLPDLVRHFGEPFSDSSALPMYYLSRMTRSQVTVALSGDGGDELFGGYERYFALRLAGGVNRIPGLAVAAKKLAGLFSTRRGEKSMGRKLHRLISSLGGTPEECYLSWMSTTRPAVRRSLYREEFARALGEHAPERFLFDAFRRFGDVPDPERAMRVDQATYLPNDILVKVDIVTMMNSLEARCPFLDRAVVEFAARLPTRFKTPDWIGKRLLRETFRDMLPPEIFRRGKSGFGIPLGFWLRTKWPDFVRETLLSAGAETNDYFDRKGLTDVVEGHLSGRADNGALLWALLVLELWRREIKRW